MIESILIKFYMQPPGNERKKSYMFGPGFMTKMAAMPIYGKRKSYVRNHGVDYLETWFIASGIYFLKVYLNNDPVLTLTIL